MKRTDAEIDAILSLEGRSNSFEDALFEIISQLRQERDEEIAKCERVATSKDFWVRKCQGLKECIEKNNCEVER